MTGLSPLAGVDVLTGEEAPGTIGIPSWVGVTLRMGSVPRWGGEPAPACRVDSVLPPPRGCSLESEAGTAT